MMLASSRSITEGWFMSWGFTHWRERL